MHKLLAATFLAGVICAQTPVGETKDSLGRSTPQESVFQFLEACHARDYSKALYYLDLRSMSPAARAKDGPDLARQLEDLLDDTPFEITTLSRDRREINPTVLGQPLNTLLPFKSTGRLWS